MPLSISSSEPQHVKKHTTGCQLWSITLLLALLTLLLVAAEVGTRTLAIKASKIESRESREYQLAVATRPTDGRKSILFLGNSLMGDGVDFDSVQQALRSTWEARRLYVENTGYYDFYYGMRRMYHEGARFDVVAVFLSPQQLIAPRVRGDYSAYRLMMLRDIPSASRDCGLHRTQASNMAFASLSAFYGLRAELRKVLLLRLMPDLPALMGLATRRASSSLKEKEVYPLALKNLRAYRELGEQEHLQIMLVLPPQLDAAGMEAIKRAAAEAGVTVVTVPLDLTGPDDFRDGFHLNSRGATKYTAALISEMGRLLNSNATLTKSTAFESHTAQQAPSRVE